MCFPLVWSRQDQWWEVSSVWWPGQMYVFRGREVGGGLGVKDIALQNQCLLLKLLHRIYNPDESAWATWVSTGVDLSTLQGPLAEGQRNLPCLSVIHFSTSML